MTNRQAVRWNIFAGIMFTVVGMCFLNYYSLFPQAEIIDRKKYDEGGGDGGSDGKFTKVGV